jgi:type I restriction enzyme R subunit
LNSSCLRFSRLESRTTSEQLRTQAMKKVRQMVAQNPTRVDLVERLEKLIDTYNTASIGVEELFERLKQFIRDLVDEEARAAREGLTEGELAIFVCSRNPSRS